MTDSHQLRAVEVALAEIAVQDGYVAVCVIVAGGREDRRTRVVAGDRSRCGGLELDRLAGEDGVVRRIIVSREHDVVHGEAGAAVDLERVVVRQILDDHIGYSDVAAAREGQQLHLRLAVEHASGYREVGHPFGAVCLRQGSVVEEDIVARGGSRGYDGRLSAADIALYRGSVSDGRVVDESGELQIDARFHRDRTDPVIARGHVHSAASGFVRLVHKALQLRRYIGVGGGFDTEIGQVEADLRSFERDKDGGRFEIRRDGDIRAGGLSVYIAEFDHRRARLQRIYNGRVAVDPDIYRITVGDSG